MEAPEAYLLIDWGLILSSDEEDVKQHRSCFLRDKLLREAARKQPRVWIGIQRRGLQGFSLLALCCLDGWLLQCKPSLERL